MTGTAKTVSEIADIYERMTLDSVIKDGDKKIKEARDSPRYKVPACQKAFSELKDFVLTNEAKKRITQDEYRKAAFKVSEILGYVPEGQQFKLLRENMKSYQNNWESKSKIHKK